MVFEILSSLGLLGLFVVNIAASSLITFPPEPFIISMLLVSSPALVFLVSLVGATIGSLINYAIGYKGIRGFFVKRFPKEEKRARDLFKRWGASVLVLSPWIPFIGDPMTLVAGMVKMDIKKFILIMTVSRAFKLMALIYLGDALLVAVGF